MLTFHAQRFAIISNLLTKISQTFLVLNSQGIIARVSLPDTIEQDLIDLCNDLLVLDLKMSAKCAKRLMDGINNQDLDNNKLMNLANELNIRIRDELEDRVSFMLSSGKAQFYNPVLPIWGKEIQDKLPNLIEDIAEANNCFALERYTACVFHLMRVMERAVQKYANKLGISEAITCDEEWQRILNLARGQLNVLYPKPKGPDRIKHESIISNLESIKNAWRNPTMHPKATYTEEETKAILFAVEIFMKNLVNIF